MTLKSFVIKETPYPEHLTLEAVRRWASAPKPDVLKEHHNLIKADLREHGYGGILISDQSRNPTGTIKDFLAADVVDVYRTFGLWVPDEGIRKMPVQRASEITAGNTGRSLAV